MRISGAPGIGKSALVQQWMADPSLADFTVLRAGADPAETDYPFGVISQLSRCAPKALRATHPWVDKSLPMTLPPIQAGVAMLGLLDALQRLGPVAVLVDDVQWCDRASLQALGFVARRLKADAVMMVTIARSDGDAEGAGDAETVARLHPAPDETKSISLEGLGASDVAKLVELAGGGPLNIVAAERLRKHTDGNPLYLHTILSEASAEELADPRAALPVPTSLASAVHRQLAEMPSSARALVEATAVLNAPAPLAQVAEMAGIASPVEALTAAAASGLVRWWSDDPTTPIAVSHNLRRQAVLAGMSPRRRQELHAAAVPLVGSTAAWAHRVAATTEPDPALAADLVRAADDHLSLGAAERSATLLTWAASVVDDAATRERHLLTAALRLLGVDSFARIQQIMPEIEACASSPLRSFVLGAYSASRGATQEAERLLVDARERATAEPSLAELAAISGVWLSRVYAMQGRGPEMAEAAEAALRIAPPSHDAARHALALLGNARGYVEGPYAALAEMKEVPDAAQIDSADALLLSFRGQFRALTFQFRAALDDLTTARRLGRESGRPVQDEVLYPSLVFVHYMTGAWDDALIVSDTSISMALAEDKVWALPAGYAWAALVPAGRGEWGRCLADIRNAEEWARALDPHWSTPLIAGVKATMAQARGTFDQMLSAVRSIGVGSGTGSATYTRTWLLPLEAEAYIENGALDEAQRVLSEFTCYVDDTPCAQMISARLEGRLAEVQGDRRRALSAYERGAVVPVTEEDAPLQRGMLEHAYAKALAASGAQRRAETVIGQARASFLQLRATPFLQRCERDQEKWGLAGRQRTGHRVAHLTGREREIAHLVARGMTNQEIAGELFISVKTVEYHLGNIYSRLGLANRRQLRDHTQQAEAQSSP